ncbi:MAG: hypothetical protein ACLPX5_09050 [Dissulfurispiraceae bacterium]
MKKPVIEKMMKQTRAIIPIVLARRLLMYRNIRKDRGTFPPGWMSFVTAMLHPTVSDVYIIKGNEIQCNVIAYRFLPDAAGDSVALPPARCHRAA